MAEPLLNVRGLCAGYGDIRVLWGIDLEIAEGEIACIVGSNGVGKTTLLRALSGQIAVSAGEAFFKARNVANCKSADVLACGIAHVPEGRQLFRGMSVKDNLLIGAYLRTDKHQVRRDYDYVVSLFPILGERQSQDATTMSGGEQQMCAIARGVMSRPILLMIDELSLGLAPRVVETLTDALLKINRDGITLMIVEQDVMTAFEIAQHAFVIESGRVGMRGTTQALAENPAIRRAYLGM